MTTLGYGNIAIIGAGRWISVLKSTENKLILRSNAIQDTASIIMTGASAKVINDLSEIAGTVTGTGAATGYYNVIPTLVE
jgi:hypothetical protein